MTITIDMIRNLPSVQSINEWRDRYYINLKGNGGSYRGETTSKVYLNAQGELVVERGKGMVSSVWSDNLDALKAALAEVR